MPIAAFIPAIIGGVATLGAGAMAAGGARSAANAQANAAQQAAQTELQMYQQTRGDLQPFMSTGSSALSQLANMFGFGAGGSGMPNAQAAMSQLENFPGFQFGRDQGVKALDHSAAARGLLLSGSQLQAATRYGTDYAMQQGWQPYVSGLEYASTLGANAAAGVGTAGANAAAGAARSQLQGGQAKAAGDVALGNIGAQLVQQGGSSLASILGGRSSYAPMDVQSYQNPLALAPGQVPTNDNIVSTLPNFGTG